MAPGREFLVTGVVQGVGYRAFARRAALRLGLTGSAENLADGSVLVRAFGGPADLAALEGALKQGPPSGRVDRLVARDIAPELADGNRFDIR